MALHRFLLRLLLRIPAKQSRLNKASVKAPERVFPTASGLLSRVPEGVWGRVRIHGFRGLAFQV